MTRFLLAALLFTLAGGVLAQDRQPPAKANPRGLGGLAQPDPKANPFQPGAVLPARPLTARNAAALLPQLEEEFEVLEAHLDGKRGHCKVAKIGIELAQLNASRVEKLAAAKAASREEFEKARLEIALAEAQYEIRNAELKETEIRIKHAKKRLEETKAIANRIVAPRPIEVKQIDPPPFAH